MRLIDSDGTQVGVVTRREALDRAKERELDLVEVAAQIEPPVCRIMDYSKYKYEQERNRREAKKKQGKTYHLKEIRIRPQIEEHDYNVKLKKATQFLKKGSRVKFRLLFRGREMAHKEIGRELFKKIAEDLKDCGQVVKEAHSMGRMLIMIVGPN